MPFVLGTGSQVTLLSQRLFKKYLEGTGLTNVDEAHWLTLCVANGLKIPYVGYVLVDCMVGSIHIPDKGVIIVKDDCLGLDKGILGMNIIESVWSALAQGNHPGLSAFKTTMPLIEGQAWARALTECHRISTKLPLPLFQGMAKLPPSLSNPPERMLASVDQVVVEDGGTVVNYKVWTQN